MSTDGGFVYSDQRFSPSWRLKDLGYGQHCPIVPIWVEVVSDPDGELTERAMFGEHELSPDDLLEHAPGFLVLYLAPLETEFTVEMAAHSLHASIEALLMVCGSDVPVHYEKMRTAIEVREYMRVSRWRYSHVILIGHGSVEGLRLLDREKPVAGGDYAELLGCKDDCRQMEVISFCCHSGCEEMASELSASPSVSAVIAPYGAFDVRWATVFALGYILKVFDEGLTSEDAVRALKFDQPMCVWRNGERDLCP